MLSSTGQRLNLAYNQLAGPLAEQQGFIDPSLQKEMGKTCRIGGPTSVSDSH
jgi:transposase